MARKRPAQPDNWQLREAEAYGNDMHRKWLAEHKKVAAIAQLHMPRVSALGHPLDLPRTLLGNASRSAKTILWCNGCNVAWPCKTYQLACDCPPFTVEFVEVEESS